MRTMPLTPMQAIIGGTITACIMSYILAAEAVVWSSAIGASSPIFFALMLAFWPWLGFVTTTQAGSWLWEGKPFALFVLNAAESFIAMFAMALVLTFF